MSLANLAVGNLAAGNLRRTLLIPAMDTLHNKIENISADMNNMMFIRTNGEIYKKGPFFRTDNEAFLFAVGYTIDSQKMTFEQAATAIVSSDRRTVLCEHNNEFGEIRYAPTPEFGGVCENVPR